MCLILAISFPLLVIFCCHCLLVNRFFVYCSRSSMSNGAEHGKLSTRSTLGQPRPKRLTKPHAWRTRGTNRFKRRDLMSLHVKSKDIPEAKRVQTGAAGTGSMVVKKGYGNECSLMIATRAPGYHTKPHQHESE